MITDKLIEDILNCEYKAYLRLNNHNFPKTGFQKWQNKLKNKYIAKYFEFNIYNTIQNESIEVLTKKRNYRGYAINPSYKTDNYDISFDFIQIKDNKDNLKTLVPILISPKENISKYDKILICLKSLALFEELGKIFYEGRVIFGSENKSIKFSFKTYMIEAKRIYDKLKTLIKSNKEPQLYQKDHCKVCEFQDHCFSKLKEEDSIALFRRVDEQELQKQHKKGIFTVKQLSYTFKPRKKSKRVKTKVSPYYLSLHALAMRENKIYVFEKLELEPSDIRIYVDMEGNTTGSFIYLIGIIVCKNNEEKKYSFWANNNDEETKIFLQIIDVLKSLHDYKIYYYGNYEAKVFRRIISQFNDEKIESQFNNKTINILKEIYRKIYFPTYSNSLKDIAKVFNFEWSEVSTAISSLLLRDKWELEKDEETKNSLIKYNLEDCEALKLVTEFLYSTINDESKENIEFVDNLRPPDEDKKRFKNMEYSSEDVEVITKCAYFEYQRNRIYWRADNKFKQVIKRQKKLENLNIKFNKILNIKALKCPNCKSKSISPSLKDFYTTTIFDLKFSKFGIKRWITQYKTSKYKCNDCDERFIPPAYKKIKYFSRRTTLRKHYVTKVQRGWGHGVLAYIIHQIVINRCSLRNLSQDLKNYFKVPADFHNVHDLKRMATLYYKQTYDLILQKLIKGNLIHADESKVKLKSNCGYMWVFTNMEEVVYLYKPNREAEFLNDYLNGFKGVLVSDFYSGYDSLDCPKQKCLVHLIRDLNDHLLKNLHDEEIKEIISEFGKILREIVETTDKYGLKKWFMRKHKKDVDRFFKKLEKKKIYSETGEKIKKKLLKNKNELFAFLDYDNIPWNNNNAEYAIKIYKDYQRLIKGCSTERGLEAHFVLLSIYQTCNYKGINFFDFLLSQEKDIDNYKPK